jgi:hypothetical protein
MDKACAGNPQQAKKTTNVSLAQITSEPKMISV